MLADTDRWYFDQMLSPDVKDSEATSAILKGESIVCPIDEQIVYDQLKGSEASIWSLLVACGYLKVIRAEKYNEIEVGQNPKYELEITNKEVRCMFNNMVKGWFSNVEQEYGDFIEALILDDVEAMNEYMNDIAFNVFSYFDTGTNPTKSQPERFYHGFVLGLLVDLMGRYYVTSNRESGFGRYDVMLEPVKPEKDDAIIIEFKVFNPRKELSMEETLATALAQIEDKKYEAYLISKGIQKERIRKYGFVFDGKNVLIG